ncbi:Mucolipin-2 [Desmophyllum pertusum]|uniref:Mucolipin-2 n=1 Tax=Desmophyllum pertusum TaxID=174260 RepID=A0A9X0D1M7_9CNID|nr:Mucolipin-2 [Desmophyllum pertusum]
MLQLLRQRRDCKQTPTSFDPKIMDHCMFLKHPSHFIKNDTFNLGRLRQVSLNFSLKTMNLKNVKAWDKPACYRLNITILFDNVKHDGRMPVQLDMDNTWLHCLGKIHGQNHFRTHFITMALLVFDAVVIFMCCVSLVLCIRSIYKSLKLAKETAKFFRNELSEDFTFSDYQEFVSLWFPVIMLSDTLTIVGSIYKMVIDQKILLETLKAATPSVARFCVCAALLFAGFMFCGWIVLGPFHPKFKTLTITAECLYSMINGDDLFNTYAQISYAKSPMVVWIFSKVYIYIFIGLFIYVVLSLFIGIIGDTYERLKDLGHLPQTKIQKFLHEPANVGKISSSQTCARCTVYNNRSHCNTSDKGRIMSIWQEKSFPWSSGCNDENRVHRLDWS